MTTTQTNRCDLLLTGGIVVTADDDRAVLDTGAVAVVGDRIVWVGPSAATDRWTASRVIDCRGKAVLPGLVDGHTHLFQALARGLGDGMSITPWLCDFMWPYATALTSEDAIAAARLAAVEAVRAGTTTVIDNHYAPSDLATTLAIADVMEQVGLRGAVARGIVGFRTDMAIHLGQPESLFRYSPSDELAITREAMQERPRGSRVEIWPGPLNPTYVDPHLFRMSAELAHEHGVRWHTHCCEGKHDASLFRTAYGQQPIAWMNETGILTHRSTLAHAIWLDPYELDLVADTGASVAHNPTSNAYLASGTMRLRELRDRGITVALGTDGPSCGHRQDIFDTMKQAVFAQRLATLDPTACDAAEVLQMATRDGAKYAGIDAGALESGRLADIVVINLHKPHMIPVQSISALLVYSARGADVETTIVGGEIIYEGGRCVRVDEQAVMAEAQARADRLRPSHTKNVPVQAGRIAL
jgi:5-methylthioadenosine/S-adenosylhomocysteine deaminase